uniref:Uncharacterized protein n=1 Tax=Romanomermis culicivorax TaxID=13658 RepID=A0A915HM85_ROMCU
MIASEQNLSLNLTDKTNGMVMHGHSDSREQIMLKCPPSPNPVISSKSTSDDWSKFLTENLITDPSKSKQIRSPNTSSTKNPFDDLVVFPNSGKRRTPNSGGNKVSSDLKDLLG